MPLHPPRHRSFITVNQFFIAESPSILSIMSSEPKAAVEESAGSASQALPSRPAKQPKEKAAKGGNKKASGLEVCPTSQPLVSL